MWALVKLAFDQMLGLIVGAAVVAALLLMYNSIFENPSIRSNERLIVGAEARAAAMAALEKRSKDNAEISKLDKKGLCIELEGKWIDTESRCD